MPIPEEQLKAWSQQGTGKGSQETYALIKGALESSRTGYAGRQYTIFLQGSYENGTNIWSESNVDIVIRLDDCFHCDLSLLSSEEVASWAQGSNDIAYAYDEFKQDVLAALMYLYGRKVEVGDNAIRVAVHPNRRKADVLVAMPLRRYYKFQSSLEQEYEEGICFFDSTGMRIVNYPKQHSENLNRKHEETNHWLKPMIRVLKNLRARLVSNGLIEAGVAPSYFLEGLLYNVPNHKFTDNYTTCFRNIINWMLKEAKREELVCANGLHYLLRDNFPTCWRPTNCKAFLAAAVELWGQW